MTKDKTILVKDYDILELLGKDREENVFTSLEGLVFEWKILQNR